MHPLCIALILYPNFILCILFFHSLFFSFSFFHSFILSCAFSFLLISLYYAFIYSRINYGIEMYSQTSAMTIRPLQITQNKVLRKLQFKSYTSNVNDLYKGFSVLKLKDVSRFKLCCSFRGTFMTQINYQAQ